MLELRSITKVYPAGKDEVEALKGIDLKFRSHEFVSILGPSGCGKTTLLNIIGGLDRYTTGDLLINSRSTKDFRGRDWDAYRNHSIGFVFQSYHLIPHQSVLQNVELALTLSGVSRRERRERARQVLEQVGLGDQMKKRPSEMSGGQMQRVAIARALVNNPDIILADEPTGALDTETSVQVMDILREISRDRLVIMVTHNPDLANRYSTRIINMLDGKITHDSLPLSDEESEQETLSDRERALKNERKKLPSMSLRTSFGLSLKNLITKKGRTLLTSFAGSIGIIGIALIYAVSNGMTAYINTVQEEALSSYPLMLEARHVDISSLLTTFMGKVSSAPEHADDGVYQKEMLYEILNALNSDMAQENDLRSFRAHMEAVRSDEDSEDPLKTAVSGVQYTYDMDMNIYARNPSGEIIISDLQALMQDLLGDYMQTGFPALMAAQNESASASQSVMMSSAALWREMLPAGDGNLINPLYEKQYNLVYGSWPSRYDEILLVVDEDGELPDLTLYALGLLPKESIEQVMRAALLHEAVEYEARSWSYETVCGLRFRVVMNSDCFIRDAETGLWSDLRQTDAGVQFLYDNGLELKVSGILRPSDDAIGARTSGGIFYTSLLTEYVVDHCNHSDIVQAQAASPDTDILSGLPFPDSAAQTETEKAMALRARVAAMSEAEKAAALVSILTVPSEEQIRQAVSEYIGSYSREDLETLMIQSLTEQMGMDEATMKGYLASRSDEELFGIVVQIMAPKITAEYAETAGQQIARMTPAQQAAALDMYVKKAPDDECAAWFDRVMTFSSSTLEKNLRKMGYVDLDSPSVINLYASTFADKERIENAIADYNETVDDLSEITYTDYVGLMMSSVTTIINAITYVLIAFVAISLIVSSIMIGVITLISVQERTHEIGILRAIGASRRNVSSMFTAETVLIGFASGTLGVVITWLLCIPINAVLHRLTGIGNLSAFLDIRVALLLVAISMLLTLFSGVIPSRSAARKDPVVALRTE
ncbi:MAG: ABC transporter ATP-binding protein/permease [Clostridiales bacterium]|nr:ABC transporter ATP-binding protein/permease [Clostridiales bacterium]